MKFLNKSRKRNRLFCIWYEFFVVGFKKMQSATINFFVSEVRQNKKKTLKSCSWVGTTEKKDKKKKKQKKEKTKKEKREKNEKRVKIKNEKKKGERKENPNSTRIVKTILRKANQRIFITYAAIFLIARPISPVKWPQLNAVFIIK